MIEFFHWLEQTSLSIWVREAPTVWAYPSVLLFHTIGMALCVFAHYEALPIAWRLAITTGFLGGLTTFSTFSAETVTLFLRQQYGWTATIIAAHVLGSLLMTLAGIGLVRLVLR